MEQLITGILTVIVGSIFTAVGMYVGFIHALRTKVAVMQVEVNELKRRVEGHSKKQDAILDAITDIKDDVGQKLNDIAINIAKINTVLTIIEPNKN